MVLQEPDTLWIRFEHLFYGFQVTLVLEVAMASLCAVSTLKRWQLTLMAKTGWTWTQ